MYDKELFEQRKAKITFTPYKDFGDPEFQKLPANIKWKVAPLEMKAKAKKIEQSIAESKKNRVASD